MRPARRAGLVRRLVVLLALVTLVQAAVAPAASADPAGPTDYRSEILAIEPSTAAFRIEMIGGDAFVGLEQLEPVEILVIGYETEPYLRFDPDGTVYENRRSPTLWANQERYGDETDLPAFANADARPEWFEVASGGSYAWHDHRSHWMQRTPPPGADPGDQVSEGVILLDVDGERVTISVASYLLEDPSPIPALLGVAAGLALAAVAWRADRGMRAVVGLLAAGAVLLLGVVAFRSVPSETEPSALLWLLPTIALVAAVVLIVVRSRLATTVYLDGLGVAMGATLLGWGLTRSEGLWRALIPSDAPGALDRAGIAIAMVVGAVLVARGVIGLVRPERLTTEAVVR